MPPIWSSLLLITKRCLSKCFIWKMKIHDFDVYEIKHFTRSMQENVLTFLTFHLHFLCKNSLTKVKWIGKSQGGRNNLEYNVSTIESIGSKNQKANVPFHGCLKIWPLFGCKIVSGSVWTSLVKLRFSWLQVNGWTGLCETGVCFAQLSKANFN